jgi:hypothetical protein
VIPIVIPSSAPPARRGLPRKRSDGAKERQRIVVQRRAFGFSSLTVRSPNFASTALRNEVLVTGGAARIRGSCRASGDQIGVRRRQPGEALHADRGLGADHAALAADEIVLRAPADAAPADDQVAQQAVEIIAKKSLTSGVTEEQRAQLA